MRTIGIAVSAAFAAALAFAAPAQANIFENLQIKVGVSGVLPDESADTSIGGDVDISDEWVPSLQVEYFFTDNISAELLCCVATHDVIAVNTIAGDVDLGEVTHFPPTVTLKYRWTSFGAVEPYVGGGVNYTAFIDDETPPSPPGPVNGIDYDQSVGPALQVGFDYRFNDHWSLNIDARRLWINTDVSIDTDLGPVSADVDIDPWVISTAIGYRFRALGLVSGAMGAPPWFCQGGARRACRRRLWQGALALPPERAPCCSLAGAAKIESAGLTPFVRRRVTSVCHSDLERWIGAVAPIREQLRRRQIRHDPNPLVLGIEFEPGQCRDERGDAGDGPGGNLAIAIMIGRATARLANEQRESLAFKPIDRVLRSGERSRRYQDIKCARTIEA